MARFNDYWTEEEQRADDLESTKEAYQAEALKSFYYDIERIIQKVEHLVDNDGKMDINNLFEIDEALDEVLALALGYVYHDEYEFEYFFLDEAKTYIADHLGFYKILEK